MTSDRLYALGIELMDRARARAAGPDKPSKAQAFEYRDGLIIAFLALIPLRRRTLAALRIGKHLVKVGQNWALDIPAEDTKTRRALEYPVSPELSERINAYLSKFRCRIPGADYARRALGVQPGTQHGPRIRFILRFGSAPEKRSAFRSICTVSAMRPQPYGQSRTQPTCEVPKTCWVKHRFKRRKSTTSCRSRASQDVLWLGPSAGTNKA